MTCLAADLASSRRELPSLRGGASVQAAMFGPAVAPAREAVVAFAEPARVLFAN